MSFRRADQDVILIEKKISKLEEEVLLIKQNIEIEMKILANEVLVFLPDALSKFDFDERECLEKVLFSWKDLKSSI